MAKNNYPQAAIEHVEPSVVRQITASLRELHDKGKPETDFEVEDRINSYFEFCEKSSMRPGVESLCLSLHITRTTLFNWANGIGCSDVRKDLILSAKAFIAAYLEQVTLQGKLNPASSCFLFKNWCNYKDTISLEEAMPHEEEKKALSAAELPKLGTPKTSRDAVLLPRLGREEG